MLIKPAQNVRDEMAQDAKYLIELDKQVSRVMERIEQAKSRGLSRTVFCPFSDHYDVVKRKFLDCGYSFKPTGYWGGVWQLTEDICW